MKIAIFSSSADPTMGGYGNITYELCSHYAKSSLDFTLFLPAGERKKQSGFPFKAEHVLPQCKYHRLWSAYFPWVWSFFLKNVDLRGFSLVHSLFDYPYCVLAARLAKKYALPFVMGAQGTYGVLPLTYRPEKYLLKWAYREAKEVIVPSVFTREQIREHSGEEYPISIIHNGVNFSRFNQEAGADDLKKRFAGYKLLLTVGMLKSRKGHDLIIRALPRVKKVVPNIKYLIVGPGDCSYLSKLAAECGVAEMVEFVGAVNGLDLLKYFHLCDVYVHTPRFIKYNFEGFGIVYLEASACGKPIVATDSGGIRDAVVEGKTGLIARDEDVEDIAAKICQLLTDKDLANNLGRQGKEYARAHDWAIISQKFIDKYKQYSL